MVGKVILAIGMGALMAVPYLLLYKKYARDLFDLNVELEELQDKNSNIADYMEGESLCDGQCDYLPSEIMLPYADAYEVVDVCINCGHVSNTDFSLNEKALDSLRQSRDATAKRKTLDDKVGRLLEFDMSKFFSAWLEIYGGDLKKFLKENKTEDVKLHQLLMSFINQGNMAAQSMADEIYKELEERDGTAT